MCGINVIADFAHSVGDMTDRIERMNDTLAHRGPDGSGFFASQDAKVYLGSTRLSIVDRAAGGMPMNRREGDAEYSIVSNGEFFNYRELRTELESKYHFYTRSDTEVALVAYIEWGEACLAKLKGQFSFAIYDGLNERLFLARDRLGIKPLYYCVCDGRLICSSEPKGVLAYGIDRRPDLDAISEFFVSTMTIGKSEPEDRSLFEGVLALPPATYAIFDREGLIVHGYEKRSYQRSQASRDTLASDLRTSVVRAVKDQIPDEVAYGVALSGGLDSSIITVIAARSADKPKIAAAIRYDTPHEPDYEYARLLAEEEGVTLIAPTLTSSDLIGDLDLVIRALDRPFESTRELGLFELFRTMKDSGVVVAFSGEGADEFNFGYYHALFGFIDAPSTEVLRELLQDKVDAIAQIFSGKKITRSMLVSAASRLASVHADCEETDPLTRMQAFYARKLLKLRLDTADRLSMAHSIECRVPYCDEDVVRASLAVPAALDVEGGTEKLLLRDSFQDMLPTSIARRPKAALPETADPRMSEEIARAFDRAVREAPESVWDILDREFVASLPDRVATSPRGRAPNLREPVVFRARHVFLLLTFLRWYSVYFAEV